MLDGALCCAHVSIEAKICANDRLLTCHRVHGRIRKRPLYSSINLEVIEALVHAAVFVKMDVRARLRHDLTGPVDRHNIFRVGNSVKVLSMSAVGGLSALIVIQLVEIEEFVHVL